MAGKELSASMLLFVAAKPLAARYPHLDTAL